MGWPSRVRRGGLPEQVDPSRGEAISTVIYIVVPIAVMNVLAVLACARAGRRLLWIRDETTQAIAGPLQPRTHPLDTLTVDVMSAPVWSLERAQPGLETADHG